MSRSSRSPSSCCCRSPRYMLSLCVEYMAGLRTLCSKTCLTYKWHSARRDRNAMRTASLCLRLFPHHIYLPSNQQTAGAAQEAVTHPPNPLILIPTSTHSLSGERRASDVGHCRLSPRSSLCALVPLISSPVLFPSAAAAVVVAVAVAIVAAAVPPQVSLFVVSLSRVTLPASGRRRRPPCLLCRCHSRSR